LAHRRERGVLLRRVEEEAQAVLRKLLVVEVAREAQPADEEVARDLDRRLADLPVGLEVRLEERDGGAREPQPELSREEVPGEAAPQDCHVEAHGSRRGLYWSPRPDAIR